MLSLKNFSVVVCCLIMLVVTTSQTFSQQDSSDDAISIKATLVTVPVIVSDREGHYIANLKQENFALYEDNVKQQIAFFDAAEEPLNIALLLDTSKSTREVLDDIKIAAREFLRELRAKDRAMIISFDYDVHLLSPLTNNRRVVLDAIERAEIGGFVGTALHDAINEVLQGAFRDVKGRKAIILLTDGKDHGSEMTADDLIYASAESSTVIYSIFYRTGPTQATQTREGWPFPRRRRSRIEPPGFPLPRGRRERVERANRRAIVFLEALAENTAGRVYESEETDFRRTFRSIAEELRHQYQLGFYPDEGRPVGSEHTLRVKVSSPDLVVRARRSYRTINQ
ncbi:MAG: VWA domain-containing protein [Acidobacteriota bacterium]